MDRRYWQWWGAAIGLVTGVADAFLLAALGVDLGTGETLAVGGYFGLSFAVLGFLLGRLAQARERERHDARTIERQLEELEASQRRVVESEKLAAIGRLAAGIAHEVRNPLGVIRASASMVQDGFGPDDEPYRACQFIVDEIDRLNGLITSLLTFARPAEPRLQTVSIEKLLDRALQLAAPEIEKRRIDVRRETSGPVPEIMADPDLVSQILLDLLHNAVEAQGDRGRIEIRVASDPTGIRVDMADDGPGVPDENLDRLFEPFFTTKSSGTGLGLAMAQRIARAHGGELECASAAAAELGVSGACFRLRLLTGGPRGSVERAA